LKQQALLSNPNTESLEAFLAAVLPSEGLKRCFKLNTKRHFYTANIAELAHHMLDADARGSIVYHACASYKSPNNRKASNAFGACSFWLDVDAGEGKPYADATEAAEAVLRFCQSTGLPQPIYVGSGYGIHVYWPLDRTLPTEEWQTATQHLEALCDHYCLKVDTNRTADIASILRPPGTHNRKIPTAPRLVQVGPLVSVVR
jgi:hypothetical protein